MLQFTACPPYLQMTLYAVSVPIAAKALTLAYVVAKCGICMYPPPKPPVAVLWHISSVLMILGRPGSWRVSHQGI